MCNWRTNTNLYVAELLLFPLTNINQIALSPDFLQRNLVDGEGCPGCPEPKSPIPRNRVSDGDTTAQDGEVAQYVARRIVVG